MRVMKKFRLHKSVALLAATVMIAMSFATPAAALVLNRGHVESLAFGGPMGLSWDEVNDRATFTVFAFRSCDEYRPEAAFAYVDGIDGLYLNVNTAFSFELNDGPFWFRAQSVTENNVGSELSEAAGPFWYAFHSDVFADNPEGSLAVFENQEIPVILLDTRRSVEREEQGNLIGDIHIQWPNAAAVEDGVTHADFQNAVIAVWEDFIANSLTDVQRGNLNPDLAYKDIHIFVY